MRKRIARAVTLTLLTFASQREALAQGFPVQMDDERRWVQAENCSDFIFASAIGLTPVEVNAHGALDFVQPCFESLGDVRGRTELENDAILHFLAREIPSVVELDHGRLVAEVVRQGIHLRVAVGARWCRGSDAIAVCVVEVSEEMIERPPSRDVRSWLLAIHEGRAWDFFESFEALFPPWLFGFGVGRTGP